MSEGVGTDSDTKDVTKVANKDEESEGATCEGRGEGCENDEDGRGIEKSDTDREDDGTAREGSAE